MGTPIARDRGAARALVHRLRAARQPFAAGTSVLVDDCLRSAVTANPEGPGVRGRSRSAAE